MVWSNLQTQIDIYYFEALKQYTIKNEIEALNVWQRFEVFPTWNNLQESRGLEEYKEVSYA